MSLQVTSVLLTNVGWKTSQSDPSAASDHWTLRLLCASDGFMTQNLFSIALVGDIYKAPLHISIQGCNFLINEHSCCSAKFAWCATYWEIWGCTWQLNRQHFCKCEWGLYSVKGAWVREDGNPEQKMNCFWMNLLFKLCVMKSFEFKFKNS